MIQSQADEKNEKALLSDVRTLFATVLTDPGSSLAYGVDALIAITAVIISSNYTLGVLSTVFGAAVIMILYFFAVVIYNQMTRVHADAKLGGGSYVSAMITSRLYHKYPLVQRLLEFLGRLGQGSLLADFPVTQSISLIAGVEALYIIPEEHRLKAAVFLLVLISLVQKYGLANLGRIMIWPVVLFYSGNIIINVYGIVNIVQNGWHRPIFDSLEKEGGSFWGLTLHGIANGATLITGVEVGYSSVNVPAQGHRAIRISMWLLYGIVLLTYSLQILNFLGLGIAYSASLPVPIQIAKHLGGDVLALSLGALTAIMLILAAQTAQSDFPLGLLRMARADLFPRGIGDSGWKKIRSPLGERFRTHGGVYNPQGVVLLGFMSIVILVLFPTSHQMEGMYGLAVLLAMSITVISYMLRLIYDRKLNLFVPIGGILFIVILVNITINKFFEGAWFTVLILIGYIIAFAFSKAVYEVYREKQHLVSLEEMIAYPVFKNLKVDETQALLISNFHPAVMEFLKPYIKIKRVPLILHFETQESEHIPLETPAWFRNVKVPPNTDLISCITEYVRVNNLKRIHLVPLMVSSKLPFKRYFFGNAIDALRDSLSRIVNVQVEYNRERLPLRLREVFRKVFGFPILPSVLEE